MDSKQEMKRFRNEIRESLAYWNKDWSETECMRPLVNRIVVEFVKWNKKDHDVLVRVRDTKKEMTNFNSDSTQWNWISTSSRFRKYQVWKMVNFVAVANFKKNS